jgi:hypothetical protein
LGSFFVCDAGVVFLVFALASALGWFALGLALASALGWFALGLALASAIR